MGLDQSNAHARSRSCLLRLELGERLRVERARPLELHPLRQADGVGLCLRERGKSGTSERQQERASGRCVGSTVTPFPKKAKATPAEGGLTLASMDWMIRWSWGAYRSTAAVIPGGFGLAFPSSSITSSRSLSMLSMLAVVAAGVPGAAKACVLQRRRVGRLIDDGRGGKLHTTHATCSSPWKSCSPRRPACGPWARGTGRPRPQA